MGSLDMPQNQIGISSSSNAQAKTVSIELLHRELYFFLLKTFQSGDVMRTGEVDPVSFDKMIEAAAAAPRRHGLAPKSEAMFASDTVGSLAYIRLSELVTGLVVTCWWIAPICPAYVDAINLQAQNSPDLLLKFLHLTTFLTPKYYSR